MDLAPTRRQEPAGIDPRPPVGRVREPRRLAVCLGLFAAFALFTVVVELGGLSWIDDAVMTWAPHDRQRYLADIADVVVTLATPQLLVVITLAVSAWRAVTQRSARILVHAGIRTGLLVVCVLSLKNLLARPGPPLHAPFRITPLDHLLHLAQTGPTGAYPSGHTTSTLVCLAVLIGLAWPPQRARARVLVALGAVVSAALVYMGYHWLTDVAGAWLLAAAILAVPMPERLSPFGRRRRAPHRAPAPHAPPRRRPASTPPRATERTARP